MQNYLAYLATAFGARRAEIASGERFCRLASTGLAGQAHGVQLQYPNGDPDAASEQVIQDNLLSIIARLFPEWHLSFSTAATLSPINGFAFISSKSSTHSPVILPGITIVRNRDLPYPEVDWLQAPTLMASRLNKEPQAVKVAVSSPLQTVFECLSASKSYAEKSLPNS